MTPFHPIGGNVRCRLNEEGSTLTIGSGLAAKILLVIASRTKVKAVPALIASFSRLWAWFKSSRF